MRNMIFIVVGLGIGLVASFYYISHSLSSLSAEPPAVTVEHLLTLTTYDQLQELRDAKLTELTAILQRITDGQSAREHLSAAQHSFMQIEMIDARIRMFPAHTEAELQSRSQPTEAAANLREECMRLAKSFGASRELRSVLNPLSTQFRITEVTPPPSPSPSPSIVVLNQLSAIHSQFELYKLQHLDKYPDLRNLGWKCLTQRTTSAGALIAPDEFLPAHLVFGPYLPSEPQNPLANSSQIIFSAGPPAPGFKATTRAGFLYDESRGRVWALNADGTLFNEATARARADAR